MVRSATLCALVLALSATAAESNAAADVKPFGSAHPLMPLIQPGGPPISPSHDLGAGSRLRVSNDAPGRTLPLDALIPEPPHPWDPTKYVVALYIDSTFGTKDAVRMEVTTKSPTPLGPDGLPYPRDVISVTLALGRNVSWAKELVAWNSAFGRVAAVTATRGSTPQTMILRRGPGGTDTLVFRKPGIFGIWYDANHFETSQFWTVFGGTDVLFTWIKE